MAPGFVAYWTKSGQGSALRRDSSVAIDPKRTLDVHCGNGLMPDSGKRAPLVVAERREGKYKSIIVCNFLPNN
jgi:hypothetical protein